MIVEKQEAEIIEMIKMNPQGLVIFCYTPLCGTCNLAGRMLEVIQQSLRDIRVVSCNVNAAPIIVSTYQIRSVPALLIFNQPGKRMETIYSFQSVAHLYEQLQKL